MRKLKLILILIVICLLVSHYYFLWQFDHSIAPTFWGEPLNHQKVFDGWFLGMLSGIDIYNTCMMFLILLPVITVVVSLSVSLVKFKKKEVKSNMKVTGLGVIQALKNIGLFLATYTFAGIQAEPEQFLFAFLIYALVSIPADIYLLNKAHEQGEKDGEPKESEG